MKSNRIAANIMFGLGIFYMTLIVLAMTPWTQQLDDIKEAIMYTLAPLPLAGYLLLVGLGYLETPRRGILWSFVAYIAVMVVSTLLARPYCHWSGWLGVMWQLLLLGPFIAFFSYSGIQRRLSRVATYITLLALGTIIFGLLIHGVPTTDGNRSGLGTWVVKYYEKEAQPLNGRLNIIDKQLEQLSKEYEGAKDKAAQDSIRQRAQDLQGEAVQLTDSLNEITGGFVYRLMSTFDEPTAKAQPMSTILNRQFYAAFLLLILPFAIGSFLISGDWFKCFLTARTETARMDALFSKQVFWQLLCLFVTVAGFYSLMKTEAKESIYGGQIVIVVMIVGLYLFWQRRPWKHRGQVLAAMTAFFGITLPLFLVGYGPKLLQMFRPGDANGSKVTNFAVSIVSRQIIWGGAFDIFFDNPIWGGGPKSFGALFPFYRRPDYNLWEISHRTLSCHNYFIDIFCDTGILGVIAFGAFFGFLMWKALVSIRTDPDPKNSTLTLCALAGLAGFMMNNMISPNARWVIGSNQLWMGLGILAGIVNRPRIKQGDGEREGRHAPTRTQSRIALALFGFTLIGWAYSAAYGVNFFNSAQAQCLGQYHSRESDTNKGTIVMQGRRFLDMMDKELRKPGLTREQLAEVNARKAADMKKYESARLTAMHLFEESLRLCPTNTTGYYKVATMYQAGRNFESSPLDVENALGAYKKLQELGPEYAQIRTNLRNVYEVLGKPEKALEQGRRAAQQTVDVEINKEFIASLWQVAETRNAPYLSEFDLIDPYAFAAQLRTGKDALSLYIRDHLTSDSRQATDTFQPAMAQKARDLKQNLYADMQTLLQEPKLYNQERFAGMNLSPNTIAELTTKPKPEYMALIRLNRDLLFSAWPNVSLNEEDDMLILAERLRQPATPLDKYVVSHLSGTTRKLLATFTAENNQQLATFRTTLLSGLNKVLKEDNLYDAVKDKANNKVKLSTSTQHRIDENFFGDSVRRPELNRAILSDAYPASIALEPREEAYRAAQRLSDWWERINESKGAEVQPNHRNQTREEALQQNRETAALLLQQAAQRCVVRAEIIQASNHLLILKQDDPAVLDEIAESCLQYADFQTLRGITQQSVERKPSSPELRAVLALACLLQNDLQEGKRQILILEKIAPNFEDIPYLYNRLYQMAKNTDKAREYAQKYVQTAPQGRYVKEMNKFLTAATPTTATQPLK